MPIAQLALVLVDESPMAMGGSTLPSDRGDKDPYSLCSARPFALVTVLAPNSGRTNGCMTMHIRLLPQGCSPCEPLTFKDALCDNMRMWGLHRLNSEHLLDDLIALWDMI